jgi:hypothetical protein
MSPSRENRSPPVRAAATVAFLGLALLLSACSGKQTWEWDPEVIEAGGEWPPFWTVADCAQVADRNQRERCIESTSLGSPIRPRPGD